MTKLYSFRSPLAAAALLAGTLALPATAQQQPRPCGTDAMMREALGEGYEAWRAAYQAQLQALTAPLARPAAPNARPPRVVVPVVVHIMHTDGADNITDQQVYDALNILNWTYRQPGPDSVQVIPYFRSRVAVPNFEFRLARLDPQGNCTNGITRHFSALTNVAGENVKAVVRWDPARYLNIWIVETIASGAGGYSFLPCPGSSQEGIVLRNDQFGDSGRSAGRGQLAARSLTHEVGHYFGLPHTWGGSNTPGVSGNCAMDDGIADTPNTRGTAGFGCPTNEPSCPGDPDPISNVQNYMNYADCEMMFTAGQAAVMRNSLTESCRVQLVAPSNLTSTGTADNQSIQPCAPTAYLWSAGAGRKEYVRVCEGGSVQFQGAAYNRGQNPVGPVTYQWSFPGGQPATATGDSPSVTYPTAGTYDVTLTVSDANGTGNFTRTGYVRVVSTTNGLTTPFVYGFDDPQFPLDPTDPLKSWEIDQDGNAATWEYNSSAGFGGSASSVRLRLRNATANTKHYLTSPSIIFPTTMTGAYLYFRRAYAPSSNTSDDVLKVNTSTDCGRSWGGRSITRDRTQLTTSSRTAGLFVPLPTEWALDSLRLPSPLNAGSHLRVRFEMTAGPTRLGNAIYLDDVYVGVPGVTGLSPALFAPDVLTVYPNPSAEGEAVVRVTAAKQATLTVYDATGRRIGNPYVFRSGDARATTELKLRDVVGPLAKGVYVVELRTNDGGRFSARALVY